MLNKMIKQSIIIFLVSTLILGCKEEKKLPISVIEVNVTNQQSLDSLILYDKDKSWEIKSILRFKESNRVIDTMNILENKL